MPAKPPRPCRAAMCSGKTTERHGYCTQHQHLAVNWQNNKHTGKRTRGSRWMAIRQRILMRDKGLCQECLRQGRVSPACIVDHIVPLAQGGTDADGNLQALCREHHNDKTRDEARRGKG